MKTYVLLISQYFPATHPRKGGKTGFVEKIENAIGITCKKCRVVEHFDGDCCGYLPKKNGGKKYHTIRANYDLWKKRIDEVNAGEAVLSLRYWTGKPYNSKQQEFARLDKDSGIGVQIADLSNINDHAVLIGGSVPPNTPILDVYKRAYCSDFVAKNDGLSLSDFEAWFKGYDLNKPMAIIHFTDFRY